VARTAVFVVRATSRTNESGTLPRAAAVCIAGETTIYSARFGLCIGGGDILVPKARRRGKASKLVKAEPATHPLAQLVEDLGKDFNGPLDPAQLMTAVTHRLAERRGVAVSAIWQMDGNEECLELAAGSGSVALPAGLKTVALHETLLGRAVRRGLPQILASEKPKADALAAWARGHRLRFVTAYPLASDSKVMGVLLVGCLQPPAKAQLTLFLLYSKLASLVLRDARLFTSTKRTLTKLSFLVEASKALNSTLDLSELLSRILDVAKSQVDAERGTLFLLDRGSSEIWSLIAHGLEKQEIRLPVGKGIAGHVAVTGEIINIPDAYADPRFNPEVDKRTGYVTRNILCLPIRNKTGKIIAVLQLLNKRAGPFSQEDADFLLTLSAHMALALENAQLHQELLEKERLEKEMALARGIQLSLLPETTPNLEGFEISLVNEPCYAVGGDYYDFLSIGPNTLLIVIADVEGKGVASALVMSNLQAALRALILHLHSLNEIVETLNRKLLINSRSRKYLSMFVGLIDLKRKSLHYINCGHVPPVIVRPENRSVRLTEGGMVIGLFENAEFERGHEKLQPGDVMVLCTDGITEAMDAEDEEYGLDRLVAAVQQVADRKASEIVAQVSAEVAQFSRRGTHLDDKVMIAIKTL
jgi:sigma-B regulation protein RsbU (phosphoserine phosphatase)